MSEIVIRKMQAEDLPEVCEIEKDNFSLPWSEKSFKDSMERNDTVFLVALADGEVAFGSTEYIIFASKDDIPSCFYYFLIRNSKFVVFALQFMNGSSGRQRVSGEELASFPLKKPSIENLEKFGQIGAFTLEQIKTNTEEIQLLKQLQETIVATISNCQ